MSLKKTIERGTSYCATLRQSLGSDVEVVLYLDAHAGRGLPAVADALAIAVEEHLELGQVCGGVEIGPLELAVRAATSARWRSCVSR